MVINGIETIFLVGRPSDFALLVSGITLMICTITDLNNHKIFPLIPILLFIVSSFDPDKNYIASLITGLLCFAPLFISARFGKGGEGDSLVMGAVGYATPTMFGLYTLLVASVSYLITLIFVMIATKRKVKQLPYVPFILIGWLVVLSLYVSEVLG